MKVTHHRCQCRGCGEFFNSVHAFDKHRVGVYDIRAPGYGRHCRTPAEMEAAGMSNSDRGWISKAMQKDRPSHLRDAIGSG